MRKSFILMIIVLSQIVGLVLAPVIFADAPPPSYNMTAYWRMEETSGLRYDSHTGYHNLTSYSASSVSDGKQNNALRLTVTGAYLYSGHNEAFDGGGGPFALALWVRLSDINIDAEIVSKVYENRGYRLFFDGASSHFKFQAQGLEWGTTPVTTTVEATTAIAIDTWYLVLAQYNAFAGKIAISINNGTDVDASHPTSLGSTTAFFIGKGGDAVDVDEFSIYNNILDSYERSWLYNSGSGRTYEDFGYPPAPTPGPSPTVPLTPTPYGYPDNVLQDPSMSYDPDGGGDRPWYDREFAQDGCYSPSGMTSDWGTEFWGITDICTGPGGEDGFWWTAETNQGDMTGNDGFRQSFTWPGYSDMYLTYWLRTLPGDCSHVRIEIYYGGSYLVGTERFTACSGSGWTRFTRHFPAATSCPVGMGCPGDYEIRFLTENTPIWDSSCYQTNYDWDRMIFVDGVSLSPTGYYGCPGEPGEPEPTPLPSSTPTPSPTWDPADPTWTPWPTATPQPTGTTMPSRTPTYTQVPFTTWTSAPTYTPWPTVTPLPLSTSYSTPPGAWGTPLFPTLAPIATVEKVGGFTPNATYEAKLEAASTSIAFGSAFATKVYTLTQFSFDLDLDPLTFYTTSLTPTATMTNPMFNLRWVTLPIGYIKGFVRYMPNLAPLIIALFAVFLWMIAIEVVSFGYRIIVWVIDKLERILNALGEWIPTGG